MNEQVSMELHFMQGAVLVARKDTKNSGTQS